MQVIELPGDYLERVAARCAALKGAYDAAYDLPPGRQRDLADALVAQIGTVDWEVEGYRSPERQRDLSVKFHWGHNHRFAADLDVPGRMEDRHLKLAAEFFEGFGLQEDCFRGKEVLDVGCWTGGTTLTLKMLGAGRVQALEEVHKYAAAAQHLCQDVYGLADTSCAPVSLYQFETGSFDCVYVPGVVYHLSDPVLGLRRLYNRLRDGGTILVESAGIDHPQAMCRFDSNMANSSGGIGEMNRGGWNWFMPSATCLGAWMQTAGFEEVQVFHSPAEKHGRVFGYGRRTAFKEMTRAGLSVPGIE